MQEMERVFSESASATTRTLEAEADFMDSGLGYLDFIKKQQINSAKGMHTYQGMPTGFTQLDDALSGICRGHFIIIGARPGVGKTTFALNLIHQMALMGIKIGFFSFEMTADEAMHKLICLQGRVDQQKAMRGMINSMEYNEVMNSYHECKRLPIYIEDQSPLKISQVVARTKRMIATFGIQVLFVDYLGEIKGDGKFTNKQEEIQMVSRGLRQLAKAMRIPIVCICQLNREAEKEQRAPRKSDLRESGQIEADAHSILMLHQEAKQQVGHVTIPKQNKISEDDYAMEGKQLDIDNTVSSKMILYIVKNRFGAQRKIEYQFDGSKGRFTEMSSMKENINELRNRFSE
jgi:replicative DNA helicase